MRIRFHEGGATWAVQYRVLSGTRAMALELATAECAASLAWAADSAWEITLESMQEEQKEQFA